jgi:uncharacterized integral membrane protein (TIGR00698 family)
LTGFNRINSSRNSRFRGCCHCSSSTPYQAKKEYVALSVAYIAILGTIGAILYIFLYPYMELNPEQYGVLVGSTLHELAHFVAVAIPGGEIGSDTAITVKLGRVALLIPVAIMLGMIFNRNKKVRNMNQRRKIKDLPIPWFIFGFLGCSLLNTFVAIPSVIIDTIILFSVFLMSMAMAGLGLGINFIDFIKTGIRPIFIGVIGFITLAALESILLYLL